ncbi:MAG: T9SS type A sorting domain-containing protein [Bacteroidetes bacterium]|nr:T9SS type A sorting domain-containing protein [Bacteroidota bacterium]
MRDDYPSPSTSVEFALPHTGYVTLKVYNVLGEEVATLIVGDHAAGNFKATWDASGLPSGVYFYRLSAGDYVGTKAMVVMKQYGNGCIQMVNYKALASNAQAFQSP